MKREITIEQIINADKEVGQIPTRKNFGSISDIDSNTRDRESALLRDKISGALHRYLEKYPQEKDRFKRKQDETDIISHVYAESLFEVSYVLGVKNFGLELEEVKIEVPERPFGTIDLAYVRADDGGNFVIGINAHNFFDQAKVWGYHVPVRRKYIRKQIHSSIAEEVAHIYVALRYSQTDSRSYIANQLGWNEYLNDRGEKFAKAFAQQYLEYKNLA